MYAPVASFVGVVRRIEQKTFAAKAVEVEGIIVDEVIGIDDALVAAEHDVAPGNEVEVLLEPVVLIDKRVGKLHGGRSNEQLVTLGYFAQYALAVGNDREVLEEAGPVGVFAEGRPVLGGYDITHLFAVQLLPRYDELEVCPIPFLKPGDGIGNYLVHIHGNT